MARPNIIASIGMWDWTHARESLWLLASRRGGGQADLVERIRTGLRKRPAALANSGQPSRTNRLMPGRYDRIDSQRHMQFERGNCVVPTTGDFTQRVQSLAHSVDVNAEKIGRAHYVVLAVKVAKQRSLEMGLLTRIALVNRRKDVRQVFLDARDVATAKQPSKEIHLRVLNKAI